MGTRRPRAGFAICRFGPVIFVTVGTQLPFPRLMQYMASIAPQTCHKIIAQTCDPALTDAPFEHHAKLAPAEFDRIFKHADIVVAHAGIGTILSARRMRKPLIIVARSGALGEHRNDHQSATAKAMRGTSGVYVAQNEGELARLLQNGGLSTPKEQVSVKRQQLIDEVRAFIESAQG